MQLKGLLSSLLVKAFIISSYRVGSLNRYCSCHQFRDQKSSTPSIGDGDFSGVYMIDFCCISLWWEAESGPPHSFHKGINLTHENSTSIN